MGFGGSFGGFNPVSAISPSTSLIAGMAGGGGLPIIGGGPAMGGVPGITGGAPAAGGTATLPGQEGFDIASFLKDNPMYKFLQGEGIRGMQRSAAAKGKFGSGNLLKDLVSFSSGLASQVYEPEIERVMRMAGVGAGSPAAAGQTYGQQAGAGTGYGQEAYGSLGGIFDLFL